ncbi:DUF962 domain-containing protein [Thalassolituus oleivorans]|uniref:Mpo1 family 2-hydroxy fatty acid dioxygenase n=1 Tax=Thalassolituus oleivorans TaxID=187493 RepID=UPI0023F1969E|nr:Mpo1-like protein [Thalassolituus oleivorans]
MMVKSADQWFSEYGSSHTNPINKLIHWVCVPLIYLVIIGLLWSIPTPNIMQQIPYLNWGTVAVLLSIIFYVRLSLSLSVGLSLFAITCCWIISTLDHLLTIPIWKISLIGFVILWIFQFIGHHVEGKKPSFFKDIQFLLIGPAWLMGFIYRKLHIPYH